MEDKIICLVGASGSGKTTIAKELEKEGYNIIHSYTTREPREKSEWGHRFINEDDYMYQLFASGKLLLADEVIAYKELYGKHYFATKKQYQGKGTSIYVVCPDGARQVKENVKDAEVITIYLQVDEKNRERRITERQAKEIGRDKLLLMEGQDIKRMDNERVKRLNNDKEIFKVIKCDYAIDANRCLEDILKDIKVILDA